jgi:hypothetical protein
MTGSELKRQVLVRVQFEVGPVTEILDRWLGLYPKGFKFGPAAVQAAVRAVTREIAAK